MKEFNWLDFCIPCKSWCCHNENPFASKDELSKFKVPKITTKGDGSCIFLNSSGRCNVYENRPFECRIFPFNLQEINGNLFWIIWNICPTTSKIECEKMINLFEKKISKKWSFNYVKQYVSYHKLNQPEKYSKNKFKIIRELKWPTD